jgi:alkanesulfonate monooxygenase SsuD/methylene tetrahydromethanopterin reductase-like flavin-dependent oxidoreductase (luciferase family)
MAAMLLGFGVPVSGAWATPGNQVRLVRRAEELGYRSAWTFQRLLVPAEPEPDPRSGMEVYRSVLDPVVSLAHLAGTTSRIRLGLAVLNMPFFSPVLMAKQLASLDVVAGGRLDVGLGIGWSRVEFAASGVPYARRGARGEEFLRVLRALWTDDLVEFHGEFYQVPRPGCSPSRCSARTRRCCWAAAPPRRCAAPAASPTAGSAPAAPTCATSTSRSPP